MTSRSTILIKILEDSIKQKHLHTYQKLEDMREQLRVIREELNGR